MQEGFMVVFIAGSQLQILNILKTLLRGEFQPVLFQNMWPLVNGMFCTLLNFKWRLLGMNFNVNKVLHISRSF